MRVFSRFLTRIFLSLFFRVKLINEDNIPEKGPFILCSVHRSALDMFFLGYRLNRWINWMAKEELFSSPISNYILKKLGAFPVKRGRGDVGSIKTAYKILEDGEPVGIFPQGTRVTSNNPKKATRIMPGAAMIASNSDVPIVPALIIGDYKPFSRITIVYGEPFKVKRAGENIRLTAAELAEISKDIMERCYALQEVSA
jgi:1-acyl-sn-glycerol-3-phosphate acyltransferase